MKRVLITLAIMVVLVLATLGLALIVHAFPVVGLVLHGGLLLGAIFFGIYWIVEDLF